MAFRFPKVEFASQPLTWVWQIGENSTSSCYIA